MNAQGQHGAALRAGQAQLGKGEVPLGSNTGPFVVECQRATDLPGTGWPWCVAFWQWCWRHAGRALPYRGASAFGALTWARSVGWACSIEHAVPGDGIVWNVGAGHLSMLARPYAETKPYVVTIDGNVGNKVTPCRRSVNLVRGCIHVPEEPTKVAKAVPDRFDVVTSHTGHTVVVYRSGRRAIGRKLPALLRRFPRVSIRPAA